MGSLARLVPRHERAWVFSRAATLCREPGDWPGPPDPRLHHRVCLAVAAIAPDLPDERLALLARYAGWSIRLDDRLDRADPDPAALAGLERSVAAVTAGRRPGPADADLLGPLPGLLDQLAGLDRASGRLLARFVAAVREAVAAGGRHALLARAVADGRRPPPTAERYLAVAARTVNYHSFGYALLLAGPDPPGNAAVDQLEPALWDAACAVRLGNDLASVRRDHAARALNVLDLRVRDGGPVTTRRSVRRRIARHARAHDQHLVSLTTPELAGPARSLTRCLRVSIGLYRHSDLR